MSRTLDTTLIEQAIEGNEQAFNQIYLTLRDSIYGFAFRMVRESSAAEDITQETFIFFIEQPERYQPERGSLLSFLCGYARNRILHYLRKNGTSLEISSDDIYDYVELEDGRGDNPLKVLLNYELTEKIEESISQLPPLQREVIILRAMRELSYQEIADIIEVEITVVKMRLYRARQNMIYQLAPYLVGEKKNSYERQ